MKNVLVTVVAALAAGSAFAADAYIESDGASGIDTHYRLKPTTKIEVDFALTTTTQDSQARLFGADYSNVDLKMACSLYVSGQYWVFGVGNASSWKTLWLKDGANQYITLDEARHTAIFDFLAHQHTYCTDAVAIAQQSDTLTYAEGATDSITLFATKTSAGTWNRQTKARIYGVKIYEGGVLVHDFEPCEKNGIPGFKDEVGNLGFISNPAAETHFTVGGDVLVEESPYVATPAGNNTDNDKHLYIDTGYYATAYTRLELDYALTDLRPSGATWYLFAGEQRLMAFLNNSGIGYGLPKDKWVTGRVASIAQTTNVMRTIFLDIPNLSAAIVTAGYTNDTVSVTTNGVFSNSNTIKLSSAASGSNYFASMKIYGCRIYESGTPVRDFRPHVIGPAQDGSAIVGLKDEITGVFITYPTATAAKRLTCGGTIAMPPYVETDANYKQYLNTGYYPVNTTRFEVDYALTDTATRPTTGTWTIFRGNNTATSQTVYFGAYHNKNGFGFINTASGWKSCSVAPTVADAVNVRRTAIVDNVAGRGSLVTCGTTNGYAASATTVPATREGRSVTLSVSEGFNQNEFSSLRLYGCRIYEDGEAVRMFCPAVRDGVAGLQDTMTGSFLPVEAYNNGTNPYCYGGAFTPVVTQSRTGISRNQTATLTATAPGATSFRWLKNGTPITGAAGNTLAATFGRSETTDSYQVIAVYNVDAAIAESEPSACVFVESKPSATVLVVR